MSSANATDKAANIQSQIAPLLKLYQEEIDRLTRFEKDVELEYTNLFKGYKELEDPMNFYQRNYERFMKLDAEEERLRLKEKHQKDTNDASKHNATFQKQIKKLKGKLEAYEEEFKELKNQEVTIAKLHDENSELRNQITEKEYVIRQESSQLRDKEKRDLIDKYEHNIKLLEEQNAKLSQEIESVKKLHEVNQNELYNVKRGLEEEDRGKQAHIDLLNEEIQKLTSKISVLEQRVPPQSFDSSSNEPQDRLDFQIKEKEIERLNGKLHNLEQQLEQKQTIIATLEQSLEALQDESESLHKELSERPNKREFQGIQDRLKMLEHLQFSSTLEATSGYSSGAASSSDEVLSEHSIEWLQQKKIQHLEAQLTSTRNSLQERSDIIQSLTTQNQDVQKQYNEQLKLVQQLEEDLQELQQARDSENHLIDINLESPLPHATPDSALQIGTSSSASRVSREARSDEQMLKIVSEQRNRYKTRLTLMEEENQSHLNRINDLSYKVDKLRDENVKLYGRIRYLQSYKADSSHTGTLDDPEDPVNSKYKSLYEEKLSHSLNPVSRFERRERDEQYQKLNAIEKIAVKLTGIIFRSKFGRIFAFFYSLLLHLFIFFILWKVSRYRCPQTPMELHPDAIHHTI